MKPSKKREELLNKGYCLGSEYDSAEQTVRGYVEHRKGKWKVYGSLHRCEKNFQLAQENAIEDAITKAEPLIAKD